MTFSTTNRVPDPNVGTQRGSAIARVMRTFVLFALFFGLLVAAAGALTWGLYTTPGPLKQNLVVDLPAGASRADIATRLQAMGVISDSRVFNGAALVNMLRGVTLKPGEYEFPAGVTMAEAINIIASGKVLTYKITIPEGWTGSLVAARLNDNETLQGEPVAAAPEGAVMADTFVFRRGMTRAKLLQDMMAAQAKLVDEVWKKKPADSPLKSKEELVTLASIVEKETGKDDERARVAAVFINRLKKGMRLQSDPTIIYGITGGKAKLDRALTKADIEAETPYNTYRIQGLPPGPIATPGRAALEAVIAPAVSQDLYFVADGSGGHAFAATLEQHNENVRKWREGQKAGIELPDAPAGSATSGDTPLTPDTVQPELPTVESAVEAAPPADGAAPAQGESATQPDPAAAPATTEPAVQADPAQATKLPQPIPKPQPTPKLQPKPKPAVQKAKPAAPKAVDANAPEAAIGEEPTAPAQPEPSTKKPATYKKAPQAKPAAKKATKPAETPAPKAKSSGTKATDANAAATGKTKAPAPSDAAGKAKEPATKPVKKPKKQPVQ